MKKLVILAFLVGFLVLLRVAVADEGDEAEAALVPLLGVFKPSSLFIANFFSFLVQLSS